MPTPKMIKYASAVYRLVEIERQARFFTLDELRALGAKAIKEKVLMAASKALYPEFTGMTCSKQHCYSDAEFAEEAEAIAARNKAVSAMLETAKQFGTPELVEDIGSVIKIPEIGINISVALSKTRCLCTTSWRVVISCYAA